MNDSAQRAAGSSEPAPIAEKRTPVGVRRRVWTAIVAAFAGLIAIALAGLPVYVFPPVEDLQQADVAVVIGPPTEQRVALAEELDRVGVVDSMLVSVPRSGGQSADELSVCERVDVSCVTPVPPTTKGEVSMIRDFVGEHSTERVIVITFAPHVARTRFILAKCFDGAAIVVAAPQRLRIEEWVYQYLYQTAAFVKAAVTPCTVDG